MIKIFIRFLVLRSLYSLYVRGIFLTGRIFTSKLILIDNIKNVMRNNYLIVAIYLVFSFLFTFNFLGNIPLISVLPFFYSFTFWLRFFFWLPIILSVLWTNPINFLSHLLPYGCPIGLIFFLPIVELISQLIRPLTLIVRLRTNLAAGHMMLYIFSYFALLSDILTPVIYFLLVALFRLEIFISMLQAYIFITLISLYVEETLN